jgi:flagellum-specific ATP synthase
MPDLVGPEHRQAAARFRELQAAYRDHQDLIHIGAYVKGTSPLVDLAITLEPEADRFLRQWVDEGSNFNEAYAGLLKLVGSS